MKKKMISLLCAVLMITGLLAGCASGKGTDESTTKKENNSQAQESKESPGEAKTNEAKADPVTLRFMWWGGDTRHAATLKAIDRYTELHPNVTIEAEYQGYDGYQQKLMTQIASGNEPDIIQLDYIWFPDLSQQENIFVDLSAASTVDLSSYNQSFLEEYCSVGGKIVALPMGTNGSGLIFNKAFYEKHNIPVDVQFTWDTLLEEAARINAEAPGDYLFACETTTISGIFTRYLRSKSGEHWMAEDSSAVTASKEELADAFAYIQKMFSTPGIQPLGEASLFASQMEQNPIWANGQLGFVMDWSGTIGKYEGIIGTDNIGVAPPPVAEDGYTLIDTKPSMVVAVSQKSKNAQTATDFINWMMNDAEAIEILGTERSVPTNEKALARLEEINAVSPPMAQMVQFTLQNPASPPPVMSSNSVVGEIVNTIMEEAAFKSITPEEAADKFITTINEKLISLKN
jgi:oligogalacturonide transport system substrate-binding protein